MNAWFAVTSMIFFGSVAPDAVIAATWQVPIGGDFQSALNAAQPGDVIVLPAGQRFVGTFWLPAKSSGPVITIRSDAALPDRRLTPADASLLPTLASSDTLPALDGTGASNWRLDGIRFESTLTGEGEIIVLQDSTNITMDRLLIMAGADGQKRAIRGNGQQITLTRSHIANIWRAGQDSQAFCAWDGAGPYTITDNYLEAASQNIMFGGANSASPARIPADIVVEGNHLTKHPEWQGTATGVKNLFELKQAKRAVIRNNLMERVWPDAQNGYAILVTVRNDQGDAPWAVVEDVLFERNLIRDAYAGVNVLGYDLGSPSGQTTRVTFRDNIFVLRGPFLLIGGEAGILTFDHNTVHQGGLFATLYSGEVWDSGTAAPRPARFAAESLTMTNNLAYHNDYGLFGDGIGTGDIALTSFTRASVWTHNVLAGEAGWGYAYPPITWQPSTTDHVSQFNPDETLSTSSAYRGAGTDGQDLGARAVTPSADLTPSPDPTPLPDPTPSPDPTPTPDPIPVPLAITTAAELPPAVEQQLYSLQFGASRPGHWTVIGGRLPAGLSLAIDGVLSGTPQKQGVVRLTVQITDGTAVASTTCHLRVKKFP